MTTPRFTAYLSSSEIIDWQAASVKDKARELSDGLDGDEAIAKVCFEFVRDEILHSVDHDRGPVTLKASEVLRHRTGFCYAKSHLLAALLRANGIPAGLCYQRLALDGGDHCLHGLNAVFLREHGWYRIDARGNRPGIEAEFGPPKVSLAFHTDRPGEADLPEIWDGPLPCIVRFLTTYTDHRVALQHLPDVELAMAAPISSARRDGHKE